MRFKFVITFSNSVLNFVRALSRRSCWFCRARMKVWRKVSLDGMGLEMEASSKTISVLPVTPNAGLCRGGSSKSSFSYRANICLKKAANGAGPLLGDRDALLFSDALSLSLYRIPSHFFCNIDLD